MGRKQVDRPILGMGWVGLEACRDVEFGLAGKQRGAYGGRMQGWNIGGEYWAPGGDRQQHCRQNILLQAQYLVYVFFFFFNLIGTLKS